VREDRAAVDRARPGFRNGSRALEGRSEVEQRFEKLSTHTNPLAGGSRVRELDELVSERRYPWSVEGRLRGFLCPLSAPPHPLRDV